MSTPPQSRSTDLATAIRWRRLAVGCALALCVCTALLACVLFLSLLPLNDQHNLYYVLWKNGIRRYDESVALGGLFHDHRYRERLLGISTEAFLSRFPRTFHKVRSRPEHLTPNQTLYINSYLQAAQDSGSIRNCWQAVFEGGRLVSFEYGPKG